MIDIKTVMQTIAPYFYNAFINTRLELILNQKHNVYFRLNDVEDLRDFHYKIVAYLSRPSIKGLPKKTQIKMLDAFNGILGTNFSEYELTDIYTYFGCGANRDWAYNFVDSGYDLDVIRKMIEGWRK